MVAGPSDSHPQPPNLQPKTTRPDNTPYLRTQERRPGQQHQDAFQLLHHTTKRYPFSRDPKTTPNQTNTILHPRFRTECPRQDADTPKIVRYSIETTPNAPSPIHVRLITLGKFCLFLSPPQPPRNHLFTLVRFRKILKNPNKHITSTGLNFPFPTPKIPL